MVSVNMENHKGGSCPYSKIGLFCQEGYCEGCEIWKQWKAKHPKSRIYDSKV
jgi:hypothetical protein